MTLAEKFYRTLNAADNQTNARKRFQSYTLVARYARLSKEILNTNRVVKQMIGKASQAKIEWLS